MSLQTLRKGAILLSISSLLAVANISPVFAASTIGTNLSTDGTLAVTGASTLTGAVTASAGLTATTGGVTITAGGLTVTAGGATITAGGLTVTAGGLTVTAGTTALNANVTLGDAAADIVTVSGTIAGASPLVFEALTADAFETTVAVTEATADNTITLPNGSGAVLLSTAGVADIASAFWGASNGIVFEGATANGFETTITLTDPTADNTITFGDETGTVITTGSTTGVTSTMITDATIAAADLNGGIIISTTGLITANGGIVQDYSTSISADAFSAAGLNVVNLEATSADVNTITNGVAGQMLILLFNDAVTVADDDTATAANAINLVGIATSFVAAAGDTLTLVSDGTSWREVSRSVNN